MTTTQSTDVSDGDEMTLTERRNALMVVATEGVSPMLENGPARRGARLRAVGDVHGACRCQHQGGERDGGRRGGVRSNARRLVRR